MEAPRRKKSRATGSSAERCGRLTQRGVRCKNRVVRKGLTCHLHGGVSGAAKAKRMAARNAPVGVPAETALRPWLANATGPNEALGLELAEYGVRQGGFGRPCAISECFLLPGSGRVLPEETARAIFESVGKATRWHLVCSRWYVSFLCIKAEGLFSPPGAHLKNKVKLACLAGHWARFEKLQARVLVSALGPRTRLDRGMPDYPDCVLGHVEPNFPGSRGRAARTKKGASTASGPSRTSSNGPSRAGTRTLSERRFQSFASRTLSTVLQ